MQETSAVHPPDVNYARSGEVAIAYQVVGEGPTDVVFVRGITGDLLSTWEQPLLVRHVEGLADCGRVLMLDKRGTGLSDRVREVQSLETTMDDIRAVMDAAASESAVLWMGGNSTGIGLLFAATYPERCAGLVLFDPRVKGIRSPDYPWAPTLEERLEEMERVVFEEPRRNPLREILTLKSDIASLRRVALPERDALGPVEFNGCHYDTCRSRRSRST